MTDNNNGCYNNLCNQVNALFKNNDQGLSIKSKYKYNDIEHKFCKFLADSYRLQKLENVKSKHVIAYVEKLQSENKSASSILTTLSAIRHYHNLTGSKNILIDNKSLNLQHREYTKVDRTWTAQEINEAKICAKEMGRLDIYHSINLSSNFGLRLEEVCKVTPKHLQQALANEELWTKGKNGQERYIHIRNDQQIQALKEALQYAERNNIPTNNKLLCDNLKGSVQKQKRSIQNYINNNQHKFIDNNRTLQNDTSKQIQSHLNYHGIRYYYCNALYKDIYNETKDKTYSKLYCSEQMGHHRKSVVATYLK